MATGTMPKTIAAVVIRMGRRRVAPAFSSASLMPCPRSRSCTAKSTNRIAFFVTRPINMIRPIMAKMLMLMLAISSPPKAPISAKGKETMIVSGWIKLSNCDARIM
jgi:hypothetical protein